MKEDILERNSFSEGLEPPVEEIDESGGEVDVQDYLSNIKIKTKQSIMGELIDRLKHDAIDLDPDFQRNVVWDDIRKSQLLESILLQMPIPSFYFDGSNEDKWQVVDGLQRLSTVKEFVVDKNLTLNGLEFLKQYNGCTFEELPYSLKRRINGFPITMYIIEEGTAEEVKFILFKRINTGGLTLTAQEIRHALNQGIPAKFVAKLANLESFKEATQYKIATNRMQDRDFVTRFIAFYVQGYEKYVKSDLDTFMNAGMRSLKSKTEEELDDIMNNFEDAMSLALHIFKEDAFRKRYHLGDRRKPINKALFETLSVNFAELNKEEYDIIWRRHKRFYKKLIHLMNEDEFNRSVSVATGQKSTVIARFKSIKKLIQETIND